MEDSVLTHIDIIIMNYNKLSNMEKFYLFLSWILFFQIFRNISLIGYAAILLLAYACIYLKYLYSLFNINVELLFDYLYKADKKVIWILHDCWIFTGHCSYFDCVWCDRWKEECHNCSKKYRYPKSLFFDNSRRNYQMKKQLFTSVKNMTIITLSNRLANLVKQSFLSKCPAKVIYNGINLDVFKSTPSDFREKYNLENKFIVLGVASVWEKRKGLDDFIQLSKVISERYRAILVGLNKKQQGYKEG